MAEREMVNCPTWIRVVEANVAAGTPYWRLTKVQYWDDQESGGTHHIYSQSPHDPSLTMLVSNGQESWPVPLDKPENEPAANFAMWGSNTYSVVMDGAASDRVEGMHMPSNHHVSYLLWWEKTTKPSVTGSGTGTGTGTGAGGTGTGGTGTGTGGTKPATATLQASLLQRGEEKQVLRFNPNAAIQKVIFQEGFVPNSPEFDLTFEGTTYIAQRAERLSDGAVRVFYVKQGDWGNVQWAER